jgi:putative acetyltransferase
MMAYEIREGAGADAGAISRLYPAAFPTEDLQPVVRALLRETPGALSLVAVAASEVIGHAVFTPCGVSCGDTQVALLGPVAVVPDWQQQGVGRALIEAGLARLHAAAVARVCVLGDPRYYQRLGFGPERAIEPPYSLPAAWRDAWQSIALSPSPRASTGRLVVPPAWRDAALWRP